MKIFFVIILLFSFDVFSYEKQFIIKEILSDEVIKIERLDNSLEVTPGDLFMIISHESKNILGYARLEKPSSTPNFFNATVLTHNKVGMIRADNYLQKIDLSQVKNDLPGRYDLIYRGDNKVASKYRPLVYIGMSQGFTAANLAKNEYLVGPSVFGYGFTRNFQASTNLISTMFKILNISLKNRLFGNDEYEVSVENGFQYFHENARGSYHFAGYLDMISNSNFNSHIKLRVFTQKPQDEYLYNNEEYENELNLELQLSYGFIFNNWSRIIFGPKADINKKKVGGVVGYYIADREFNTMIGITSNDFSEFKVGKQGYLLNLDFWWRF